MKNRLSGKVALLLVTMVVSLSTQASQRTELRVMAYNIMQLPVQDWDQRQRLEHLDDALRTLAELPDVIAFSEVFTNDAYSALQSMNDLYPFLTPVVGLRCSGGGWQSTQGNCSNSLFVIRGGVVIASRWPIVAQHQYVFDASLSGSWDYQSNKGAAYVEIDKQGERFHIVGTHLQATHDDVADTEHGIRMQQLTEMHRWLDGFAIPKSDALILAGDMNVDFSKTEQVREMLAVSQTALDFDAQLNEGSYPENNWMSRAYAYYFDTDRCYNDTLDYVLHRIDHRQPVNRAQMAVIPLKSPTAWSWWYLRGHWSLCEGEVWHDGTTRDLSDHYPVMTTYRF